MCKQIVYHCVLTVSSAVPSNYSINFRVQTYKTPVRSTQRYHFIMINPASRIIFLLFVVRLSYSVELGSRQTYGYV